MTAPPIELLLVEDNPSDAKLTLHVFKRNNVTNGIKIANDGAEALEYLFGTDGASGTQMQSPPRLILLDLKLPKVDGLDVLEKIKSNPCTKAIPVVILTSSREDRDLNLCYELGANSYIVKPVDFGQFAEAVRQVGAYWLLWNERPNGKSAHGVNGANAPNRAELLEV